MNCNEEFIVKAIGKLTLEFGFDWQEQRKINEILHLALYSYNVLSTEASLVGSDIEERDKNDDGTRYTSEDVIRMRNERLNYKIGLPIL